MTAEPTPRSPLWALVLLVAWLGGCTSAAAVEAFTTAHGEYYRRSILHPLVNVRVSHGPDGGIEDQPLEVAVSAIALDALVTPPIDRDSFLVVGALADIRHYRFGGAPQVADEDLYGLALRVGYGGFVNDDISVLGWWEPSLYSDLDGSLNGDDYQLGNGVVLVYARQSNDLFWKFGVGLSGASDIGFAPVLGAVWHLNSEWILDVLLPVKFDLHYRPAPQWDFTTGLDLRANKYRIRSPGPSGEVEQDLNVQDVIASVGGRYRFDAHLSSQLLLGSVVSGTYEFGGGGPQDPGGTPEPSMFVQWEISWDF